MATLGEYLRAAREKAGYSQKQVHEKTGITDSRLSRIEHDSGSFTPEDLIMLANLYNASIVNIFLMAGYLNKEDLSEYQQIFHGVSMLSDEEKDHIQQCINLLNRRRDSV